MLGPLFHSSRAWLKSDTPKSVIGGRRRDLMMENIIWDLAWFRLCSLSSIRSVKKPSFLPSAFAHNLFSINTSPAIHLVPPSALLASPPGCNRVHQSTHQLPLEISKSYSNLAKLHRLRLVRLQTQAAEARCAFLMCTKSLDTLAHWMRKRVWTCVVCVGAKRWNKLSTLLSGKPKWFLPLPFSYVNWHQEAF